MGGLTPAQSSSWILATFLGNSLLTLFLTWYYRSPQAYGWTIPGTVLAADALLRFSYAEVIGTYLVTGVLVFILGWTGIVRAIMRVIPYPVVMAMVAGVFLSFGLELIDATIASPLMGLTMIAVFILLSVVKKAGALLPPVLGAVIAGTGVALATGQAVSNVFANGVVATPVITWPEFNAAAMLELVIPMTITVIIVQNGQGVGRC